MIHPAYRFTALADEVEIAIYDIIDPFWGISAAQIRGELRAAGDVQRIHIRIHSPGGSIVEGTALYSLLKSHPARKRVTVDGLAASMASIVAMAGDEIEIAEGAYMMIHDPIGGLAGDADEFRAMAEVLDKMKGQLVGIYARRTGNAEAEIEAMMTAETWMTGAEAVAKKFADRSIPSLAAAASARRIETRHFHNVPPQFRLEHKMTQIETKTGQVAAGELKSATFAELKSHCKGADAAFLCGQLEAGATIETARAQWLEALQARNDELAEEAKTLRAQQARKKEGVAAVGTAGATQCGDADPIAAWNAIVGGFLAAGMSRGKAIAKAVRENPEGHEAYLEAYNALFAGKRP